MRVQRSSFIRRSVAEASPRRRKAPAPSLRHSEPSRRTSVWEASGARGQSHRSMLGDHLSSGWMELLTRGEVRLE